MSIRSVKKSAVVIAVSFLLASVTGCSSKPTASITGMTFQDMSLTEGTMLFNVKVDNPYGVPLPLGNLDYALASEGHEFLSGHSVMQGTIPAQGSKTLPVPVKVNFMKLMGAVKGARPGASIPYKADMGLSVDVPITGSLRVPMSKEGNLEIPSKENVVNKILDFAK